MNQHSPYAAFEHKKHCLPFNIQSINDFFQDSSCGQISSSENNQFNIIWITAGAGTCLIDLQKFVVEKNYLFFLKTGQIYQLHPTGELNGYVISFTTNFFEIENMVPDATYDNSLFQVLSSANKIRINDESTTEMMDITLRMIKEFNQDNLFRDELLRRYLKIFLIYLSRQMDGLLQTTPQTRNMELVQKFMSLLDKHYKTEKTVCGYASQLCVTPNYLNEIIKKITGHSAGYHIRQRIVLEAKRQATYSDTCMKQIGYYLGFSDMAHFSKFFKNATGINFTDFKKEKLVIAAVS